MAKHKGKTLVTVYIVTDGYTKYFTEDWQDIGAWMSDEPGEKYMVTVGRMTREEIDAMGEFDGF